MKIGLQFPSREIEPSRAAIRAWLDATMGAGADYIMLADHILGVDPEQQKPGWDKAWMHPSSHRTRYTHRERWHEPLVMMGFIAALCELELMTGILVLPQRNTALVAKQAAQVDLLSGGRLRLGVGVGWNAAEFESIGASFADRGRRFSEQVRLLRRYWTEEVVTFDGQFHCVRAAGIAPLPVQRPIPLWIGGASLAKGVEAASKLLARIGELGDGWCLDSATLPDETTAAAIRLIRETAHKHGRDPSAIGVDARLCVLPLGRDGLVQTAAGWGTLGATHLTIDASGVGATGTADGPAMLREFVGLTREAAARTAAGGAQACQTP